MVQLKSSLPTFFAQLKKASSSVLMVDFDGTISPFTIERERAFPYPGVVERLRKINTSSRVIIISGRSVKHLVPLLDGLEMEMEVWGSHGLEKHGADCLQEMDEKLAAGIHEGIESTKGCVDLEDLEIKTMGVGVHWRRLGQAEKERVQHILMPSWEAIAEEFPLEIHIFRGGMELRPADSSKGKVVKRVIGEVDPETVIAYLGDDQTDEEAFAALGDRGFKVLIREQERKTLADVHLKPPEELFDFLDKWIEATNG